MDFGTEVLEWSCAWGDGLGIMLASRTIHCESLQEATNIILATMGRFEGADMLVKPKFSMKAWRCSVSGADFYGCKVVVSVRGVSSL